MAVAVAVSGVVALILVALMVGLGAYSASGSETPPDPAPRAAAPSPSAPVGAPTITASNHRPSALPRGVRQVRIPGAVSRFRARPGYVYLPPAARRPNGGLFPVVIALSGQSRGSSPRNMIDNGRIAAIMDAIAAKHGGRAPIVVIPDQLGQGSPNPMCVDSRMGDVATYITVDVRRWALRHLPVLHDRRDWTVAGFSEGGTCAIQFGAGYPKLFGSIVDISGELGPANGSLHHTIAVGFAGNRARYERAMPAALLSQHAPYSDTRAIFTVGALDKNYGPVAPVMARDARAAGMRVSLWVMPKVKHNWPVAVAGLTWAMNELVPRWNLKP